MLFRRIFWKGYKFVDIFTVHCIVIEWRLHIVASTLKNINNRNVVWQYRILVLLVLRHHSLNRHLFVIRGLLKRFRIFFFWKIQNKTTVVSISIHLDFLHNECNWNSDILISGYENRMYVNRCMGKPIEVI